MKQRKTVVASGGFDPVHVGHLRMFKEASQHGDVIVIVNSDDWLQKKKGYVFMEFKDRCEIIRSFGCVSDVTWVDDDDGTVCEALTRIKPDYFANGGDRIEKNTPEIQLCENLKNCGVNLIFDNKNFVLLILLNKIVYIVLLYR